MNFTLVLALPKMARSAQTHKSIGFIWMVWSTLYVYLCALSENIVILWICQALTTVIFFPGWDKSRDSSVNSSKLEQMEWAIVPSKHQCSDCEKTSPYLNDSYSRSFSKSKEYSSSLVDLNQIPTFYKTSYKESYNNNAFDNTMIRPMTSYGY